MCIHMYLYLYVCNIPLYVNSFVLSINGPLTCLHLLGLVNSAAVTIQIAVQVPAFTSLDIYPEVELLGHIVILCLFFKKKLSQSYPQVLYHFISLPTLHKVSNISISWPTFISFFFFFFLLLNQPYQWVGSGSTVLFS